jgi:hypothetical protein
MNKSNKNGGRRIPKRPVNLPALNIGQITSKQRFSPEVQSDSYNYSSIFANSSQSSLNSNDSAIDSPSSTSSWSSSPGSSFPVKIHDDCSIFLGCELDALDKDFLQSQNITTILSIQSWEIQDKQSHIKYHWINANDNSEQDLKSKFDEICNFLKRHEMEGNNILVHCQAGISRSATACLAYLMKEKNMSLDTSFVALKKRREIVCPNFSFLGQLKRWEHEIMVEC